MTIAFARALVVATLSLTACVPPSAPGDRGEGEGEGEGGGDGEGEIDGEPLVESDEGACDIGVVVVDDTATCSLTLRNRGTAPATLVGATTRAPFVIVDDVSGALLPGAVDVARLTVAATPTSAGTFEDTIAIAIEGGEALVIAARVTGRCAPTAVIAPPARAFVSDAVVLDGTASVACADAPIASFAWSIASEPASANAALSATDAATTTLRSESLGAVDVTLFVADADGFGTRASATVTFDARLSFLVEDALVLGLEPHVMRAGDARCSIDDCFDVAGCGFLAASPPEWDGVAGRSNGDPLFGESDGVRVPVPGDGAYVVGVYARETAGATVSATAVLDVVGVVDNSTRALSAGDFWTVANVDVAGGVATVAPVDSVETGASCP